jgi:hypothetical protein
MAKHYVTVLDLSKGEVHIYPYTDDVEDLEVLIAEKGHRLADCSWMCSSNLILQIHE